MVLLGKDTVADTGMNQINKQKAWAYGLKRKYGITPEQYNVLLENQGSNCFICDRPAHSFKTRLCVDHDHKTMQLRGLLCHFCNTRIIGRHRDPEIFRRAGDYLSPERFPDLYAPKLIRVRKKKKTK